MTFGNVEPRALERAPFFLIVDSCRLGILSMRASELVVVQVGTLSTFVRNPQGDKSFIINLSCGSIAGMPLCCQQRTAPCTRREQGVPFLVRAPQM
jgi:hypothetical protein